MIGTLYHPHRRREMVLQPSVIELIEQHLTQVMEFPPGMFRVALLRAMDIGSVRLAVASPANMSRGGDLPFVVFGERVTPGNHAALEEIVRTVGLPPDGALSIERFVDLFFLLVVVGRGGASAAPTSERVDGQRKIVATNGDGVDHDRRTYVITIAADGGIAWEERT